MGYKILGMVVWKGGKFFLRRKYPLYAPTPVIAGGAVLAVLGVLLLARGRDSGD